MSKTTKPSKPVQLPSMTAEEKERQVARFLAQKREAYFQLILGNIIQTGKNTNIKECVDAAIEGSAYIMEKMYTESKEGE